MSDKLESENPDDEVRRDSLNTEAVVIDVAADTTFRPIEEWFRKILEQKGVIPRRPQPPSDDPAS
jgi:hypothetical protein